MKSNLTNSDLFADTAISPDDLDWLEPEDTGDDILRDSYGRQEWLDDDEPLLSSDYADAVDSYFQRAYRARHFPHRREAW